MANERAFMKLDFYFTQKVNTFLFEKEHSDKVGLEFTSCVCV